MSLIGLLPQNSAPWERALAAAMSDTLPVPIVSAMNPATAPVAFLPWLAAHDGVRLWFSDWSAARKRQVIAESLIANFEVGTRAGAIRYLSYVDATLVDVVAYPAHAFAGRAFAGHAIVEAPPFKARYLIRVDQTARVGWRSTVAPGGPFVAGWPMVDAGAPTRVVPEAFAGRVHAGRSFARATDDEKQRRALAALRVSKGPETEYRVDFQHSRPITAGDAILAGAAVRAGAYVARTKL